MENACRRFLSHGRWVGMVAAYYCDGNDDDLIFFPGVGFPELAHLNESVFASEAEMVAVIDQLYRSVSYQQCRDLDAQLSGLFTQGKQSA